MGVCKIPEATGLGAHCEDPEGDLREDHLWRSICSSVLQHMVPLPRDGLTIPKLPSVLKSGDGF